MENLLKFFYGPLSLETAIAHLRENKIAAFEPVSLPDIPDLPVHKNIPPWKLIEQIDLGFYALGWPLQGVSDSDQILVVDLWTSEWGILGQVLVELVFDAEPVPDPFIEFEVLEEQFYEVRSVIGGDHHEGVVVLGPVDAVDGQDEVISDEAYVEDKIDGHEVVFEHFVDREGACQDPEEPVDPYRLVHISLLLSPQHQGRKVPSQGSKQIQKTVQSIPGRIEDSRRA